MSVLGYCTLHYGLPYLAAATSAIYPQVDRIVILYTATPSQGFAASTPCPDTEAELQAAVAPYMDKIEWVSGSWSNEGEHNDAVRQFAQGFDWIVRYDADEIFPPGTVAHWVGQAELTPNERFRAPFLHFWRNFNKVCRDGQMPERLMRAHGGQGFAYLDDGYLVGTPEKYRVYHMGYAQPTKYIEYKMQVQAHHNEWRPEWYEQKWLTNSQEDLHPVVYNFWNTEDYGKELMPKQLKEHAYYEHQIIL